MILSGRKSVICIKLYRIVLLLRRSAIHLKKNKRIKQMTIIRLSAEVTLLVYIIFPFPEKDVERNTST